MLWRNAIQQRRRASFPKHFSHALDEARRGARVKAMGYAFLGRDAGRQGGKLVGKHNAELILEEASRYTNSSHLVMAARCP